ncbi:MFS transporter [Eubacterium aggregans]|uniref:MFS transporter n=1 Tax=Eubacterium aggregans TaxID=81409 RepID=UPI003F3CA92D
MEAKDLSKKKRVLILVALFLSTCCTMWDMVIVPIASNLYSVFENVMLVNAIISGPAITGVLFCIIGGRLTDRMNKKTLMVIGFSIFTVTSIFGCTVENGVYILICRLMATGVAWGLTSSAALGILAELYLDEKKHGTIIGWYNAAMAIIGAMLSLVAGNLAVNGWQLAFQTYWIAIPVLAMLIVFLSSMPSKIGEKKHEKIKGDAGWYRKLIPLSLQIFFVGVVILSLCI